MAHLILFHHAQGLTEGVEAFAEQVRAAGHSVTLPDLYHGATFATISEGVSHAEDIGFEAIVEAGIAEARRLPAQVVYGGFSLGALPAQKLAQTRPGALGLLLYHADVPFDAFGQNWPRGVDVQVHVADDDEWCELDLARELVERVSGSAEAELFVYPGSTHLFTDSSLADYLPGPATLVMERTLEFLEGRG